MATTPLRLPPARFWDSKKMGRDDRRRPRPLAQRELLSAGARLFFCERAKSAAAAAAAGCGRKTRTRARGSRCTLCDCSERARCGTPTLYCHVQSSVYSENAQEFHTHIHGVCIPRIGLCAGLKAFTALRECDLEKKKESRFLQAACKNAKEPISCLPVLHQTELIISRVFHLHEETDHFQQRQCIPHMCTIHTWGEEE